MYRKSFNLKSRLLYDYFLLLLLYERLYWRRIIVLEEIESQTVELTQESFPPVISKNCEHGEELTLL